MKTIALGQVIDTPTNLETVAMTIDEASVSVLMRNLTNLYSNPSKAVFREYVCNALDSHIKAGVSTPIEVELPSDSDINPVFSVQDFGVGLSKQEIIDIYSRYGSSTKRDSNEQIGAFGLGAKSALAIADRFDVVTIKDNKRVEFFVQKNGQGVGVVHFVSETETVEGNGVTVTVPIPRNKVSAFAEISKDFFQTWKANTVRVNGTLNSETIHSKDTIVKVVSAGEDLAWIDLDDKGGYSYSSGLTSINFVVGGIVYQLDRTQQNSDKLGFRAPISDKYSELTRSAKPTTYINLPIGSVELTPSREELMLTDRTVNTIVSVVSDLIELAPQHFAERLNNLDRAEAFQLFGRYTSFFGGKPTTWKGEAIAEKVELELGYEVYSREGSAMKEASVVTNINLLKSLISSGYGSTKVILIKTNKAGVTSATADLARKNLRDYATSVYNHKNITAYIIDEAIDNAWLDMIESVSLDTFIEKAKAFRSAKKSAAQSGTTRSKATYVVWNGEATLTKVSADGINGKVIYAEENTIGGMREVFGIVSNFLRGDKGNLSVSTVSQLKAMFGEQTVIFLPANRSVSALIKQYPSAVSVADFQKNEIAGILSGDTLDSEVMATVMLTSTSSFEVLGKLNADAISKIDNVVVRSLAGEVKNAESRMLAFKRYAQTATPAGKGIDIDAIVPVLSMISVSSYRPLTEAQADQIVSLVNMAIAK